MCVSVCVTCHWFYVLVYLCEFLAVSKHDEWPGKIEYNREMRVLPMEIKIGNPKRATKAKSLSRNL